MSRPPAVVLGGGPIAVSVARSLAPLGIAVYAAGHRSDPVRHSRHCAGFAEVGGADALERRLEWLQSGPRGAVVLPGDDGAVELVAKNRDRLLGWGYRPVEGDDAAQLAMISKSAQVEVARRAGLEAPRASVASDLDEARRIAREIGYPLVLKPVRSHSFAGHYGLSKKVFIAAGEADLAGALEETTSLGLEMMLAEIVPGPEDAFHSYYTYLDAAGRPLFHATKRKIRQYPPGFGLGCYHETDWCPEVAELGLRFVRTAGIHGLAAVEFKRDSRDGRLKLVECNARLTAATELLRVAGMDLPILLYERALGRPYVPASDYRTGVTLWFPIQDTMALLAARGDGRMHLGRWLRSVARRHRFPVASLRDPMPTLGYHARWAGRVARRKLTRGRRGGAGG